MKKWIAAALALLLVLGGVYFGSPYYALYSLRSAALAGDAQGVAAKVDFPAVRASLKAQVAAAMAARMREDPEVRENPLAGLGAILLPSIAGGMVDALVTPKGIAALLRGRKPTDGDRGANPDIERRYEYVGLDRFRLSLRDSRRNRDGPSFLLDRRGFASWKLVAVELPADPIAGEE